MLKVRLIPVVLLKNGRMIKTKQFGEYRDVGNPTTVAKVYNAQKADELVFLDITATEEKRNALVDIIKEVAKQCFMPLAVGGGIKTIEQASFLLKNGADKIVINTAAVENPFFINQLADKFGRSTVVVSIDYKKNDKNNDEVFINGGRVATGLDPLNWAKEVEKRGAGEVMLTAIDREGMMVGYDLNTIRQVADGMGIPVIANGGAATVQDFVKAVVDGHASAVAASSIFNFTDQSVFKGHTQFLHSGLPSRL